MAHNLLLFCAAISWEGDAMRRLYCLAVLVLSSGFVPAAGAVTITTSDSTSAFSVSGSDLLQTDLASVTTVGTFGAAGSAPEAVLRDGANPNSGGNDFAATSLVFIGASVTYELDITLNTQGYSISAIDVFGHWDEGRDRQDVVVEYSVIADPGTFLNLASWSFDPTSGNYSWVNVAPESGSFIATSVAALRFSFPNQENQAGGYREIDVVGVPVPEPGTALLLASGLLGLALHSRRSSA